MATACNMTQGVRPGSPAYVLSAFSVAFFISFLSASCCFFLYNQQRHVYLRKRRFAYIALSCVAVLFLLSFSSIHDLVGQDSFPCALLVLLFHFGTTLSAMPILCKVFQYAEQNWSTHVGKLIRNTQEQHGERKVIPVEIPALANWDTFRTYLRLALPANTRRATLQEKYKSLQFMKSNWFIAFWYFNFSVLAIVAVVVHLCTDESIVRCPATGCTLSSMDLGFEIANTLLGVIVITVSFPLRKRKHDNLYILKEVNMLAKYNLIQIIAFVLVLIDPNELMARGEYNWMNLVLVYGFAFIYYQTWHQVFIARRIKRELFASKMDLELCYAETVRDPLLLREMRVHLDSELSSEIYWFLDSVALFKASFKSDDDVWDEAKDIYLLFLRRGALHEVNVSSHCRDALGLVFAQRTPISAEVFDEAEMEVKSNFLHDGFVRFLFKVEQQKRRPMAIMALSSSSVVTVDPRLSAL